MSQIITLIAFHILAIYQSKKSNIVFFPVTAIIFLYGKKKGIATFWRCFQLHQLIETYFNCCPENLYFIFLFSWKVLINVYDAEGVFDDFFLLLFCLVSMCCYLFYLSLQSPAVKFRIHHKDEFMQPDINKFVKDVHFPALREAQIHRRDAFHKDRSSFQWEKRQNELIKRKQRMRGEARPPFVH